MLTRRVSTGRPDPLFAPMLVVSIVDAYVDALALADVAARYVLVR